MTSFTLINTTAKKMTHRTHEPTNQVGVAYKHWCSTTTCVTILLVYHFHVCFPCRCAPVAVGCPCIGPGSLEGHQWKSGNDEGSAAPCSGLVWQITLPQSGLLYSSAQPHSLVISLVASREPLKEISSDLTASLNSLVRQAYHGLVFCWVFHLYSL